MDVLGRRWGGRKGESTNVAIVDGMKLDLEVGLCRCGVFLCQFVRFQLVRFLPIDLREGSLLTRFWMRLCFWMKEDGEKEGEREKREGETN
jgi:hypothetical protein